MGRPLSIDHKRSKAAKLDDKIIFRLYYYIGCNDSKA